MSVTDIRCIEKPWAHIDIVDFRIAAYDTIRPKTDNFVIVIYLIFMWIQKEGFANT